MLRVNEEDSSVACEDERAASTPDQKSRSSGRLDRSVDKDLECPVCFQTLKDPFLTACGHSFCYSCISMHLSRRNSCPSCSVYLSTELMYPNVLLAKVIKKLVTFQSLRRASPAEHLQIALQHESDISLKEIDSMLNLLTEGKTRAERKEAEENMEVLLELLHELHSRRTKELETVEDDLRDVDEDLETVRKEISGLQQHKHAYLRRFSRGLRFAPGSYMNRENLRARAPCKRKSQFLNEQHEVFRDGYIEECRRSRTQAESSSRFSRFRSFTSGFFRYRKLDVLSETCSGYSPYCSNIVSSIEFDRDDEFFATAGVSGHLKVYDYKIVSTSNAAWDPVLELQTRSKMSCVSWDNDWKSFLATCDYDGVVKIWDVCTCQTVSEYEEHEKRTWSVDFSSNQPSKLVSGGDDGKIKLWSREKKTSALTVEVKANICSVKFNPGSNDMVAAASADHCVYYFDLRQTKAPVHVFTGHEKAVSYVKFLSPLEMASASTDGTLRLWNMERFGHLRTFKGHTNEKNFVGLSVSSEYIACGSETNEVFVFHKGITIPAITHKYPLEACDESPFISAVCWNRSESRSILAANSQGKLRALKLAP